MTVNRALGNYAFAYWFLIGANVVLPLTLWWRKWRTNLVWLFALSIIVQVGMWTERVVIVVQSLHRDFMPSAWQMYYPTGWDWATLIGTVGMFFCLFFLFIRVLPMISIHEVQDLVRETEGDAGAQGPIPNREREGD
jgi:molybdopterin-containing oxidoreductase family membrane subunit